MKQFRYKEWLFVEVESIFYDFRIGKSKKLKHKLFASGGYDGASWELPEGQYSIIGKADELTEKQCRELVGNTPYAKSTPQDILANEYTGLWVQTAKEWLIDLLESYGYRSSTTLVLKLNEAHTGDKVNN